MDNQAQREREAERAAIVAWLRAQWNGRLQSSVFLADAIERADHLDTKGTGNG
jgi:hypothetical protein